MVVDPQDDGRVGVNFFKMLVMVRMSLREGRSGTWL
jgi:hypothetical protein